jgi:hypothetical protein
MLMRSSQARQTKVLTLDYEEVTSMDTRERINLAGKLLAMFEADARALSTAQEGERRSNGMDYRAQAESKQVDEVEARERKALIASLVNLSQTYHERTKAMEEKSA